MTLDKETKKRFIEYLYGKNEDGGGLLDKLGDQLAINPESELRQFLADEKELSRQEGIEEGYFQGVKMLEWRINCDTLISELSGWKGCVDMAVDESLDTYKNNTEQREYLTKTRTKRQY